MASIAAVLSACQLLREAVLIFVTVGNWHKGFGRLVEAMDSLIAEGALTEDVVAQIGSGTYEPSKMEYFRFCSPEEFQGHFRKARVIVGHGGMGTIAVALRENKTIVVVPRRPELGEVSNGHQLATARQLEIEGRILVAYETENLLAKLREADDFAPAKGPENGRLIQAVAEFVEACAARRSGFFRPKRSSEKET